MPRAPPQKMDFHSTNNPYGIAVLPLPDMEVSTAIDGATGTRRIPGRIRNDRAASHPIPNSAPGSVPRSNPSSISPAPSDGLTVTLARVPGLIEGVHAIAGKGLRRRR
jgi:hypothetical protein